MKQQALSSFIFLYRSEKPEYKVKDLLLKQFVDTSEHKNVCSHCLAVTAEDSTHMIIYRLLWLTYAGKPLCIVC